MTSPYNTDDKGITFYRDLFKPFPSDAYYVKEVKNKEGRVTRSETYLSLDHILQRLDSVCGVAGWRIEKPMAFGEGGMFAGVSILCPVVGGSEWVTRWDAAGKEDMGAWGKGGEWEEDVDNATKSASTNSLRRVLTRMWGFGRNLYGAPMPDFVDDLWQGVKIEGIRGHKSARVSTSHNETRPSDDRRAAPSEATRPPERQRKNDLTPPDPSNVRARYAWLMQITEHFGDRSKPRIFERVRGYCKKQRIPERTDEWTVDQCAHIYDVVVESCKRLDGYAGEFGGPSESKLTAPPSSDPKPAGQAPSGELASAKTAAIAVIKSIVVAQGAGEDNKAAILTVLGEIAAHAQDGQRRTGQVMDAKTWQSCDDLTWIRNIKRLAEEQMTRVSQQLAAEAEANACPPQEDEPEVF